MSDLISRQAAIETINRLIGDTKNCKVGTVSFKDGIVDGYCRIRSELLALPSADTVPVVRCKYCKHSHPWYADRRTCVMWSETGVSVFNDGFCSYGERRDDE